MTKPECPICKESTGRVDEITPAGSTALAYGLEVFWDEFGDRHVHDEEPRYLHYECDRGHTFSVGGVGPCPVQLCAWNEENADRLRPQ